jgi:hypothetical protein
MPRSSVYGQLEDGWMESRIVCAGRQANASVQILVGRMVKGIAVARMPPWHCQNDGAPVVWPEHRDLKRRLHRASPTFELARLPARLDFYLRAGRLNVLLAP